MGDLPSAVRMMPRNTLMDIESPSLGPREVLKSYHECDGPPFLMLFCVSPRVKAISSSKEFSVYARIRPKLNFHCTSLFLNFELVAVGPKCEEHARLARKKRLFRRTKSAGRLKRAIWKRGNWSGGESLRAPASKKERRARNGHVSLVSEQCIVLSVREGATGVERSSTIFSRRDGGTEHGT
eukprot:scaffold1052_cov339-Pavlova_lutheri.AAC.39